MLDRLIEANGEAIARRWVERAFETYPAETAAFLGREEDPFANPAGAMVREAAPALVGALASGEVGPEVRQRLGELMHLRSVQDLTAPEAVAIVLALRRAVADVAGEELDALGTDGVAELADRTDRLLLAAFEAFVESRERLHEARLRERDRHRASLIARARRVLEERDRSGGVSAGI